MAHGLRRRRSRVDGFEFDFILESIMAAMSVSIDVSRTCMPIICGGSKDELSLRRAGLEEIAPTLILCDQAGVRSSGKRDQASWIASSSFFQSIIWKLNKFDALKDITDLREYEPRHDPTVIPRPLTSQTVSIAELDCPRPRTSPGAYYTSGDYHALYKSGKLTPTDVAKALLPLIDRDSGGAYSVAFLQVRDDLVLKSAEASTKRYKVGKPLSPLDGVPIAIKDEVDLTGYRKTYGSALDFTDPKDRTAFCVAKWQEAGALIIGKTNMHELGLDTTNNNLTWGTPKNPHNAGYYTGGSSGGSAFAVASGICPIALGVDGGGSIRLPSSFCGVFGLKPSHGRVSERPDVWNSVAVSGPIASSIDDLALAYRIMAQPDPDSRFNSAFPSPLVKKSNVTTGPKTIGIFRAWIDRSDKAVQDMFNRAVDIYVKSEAYDVVDIEIPYVVEGQKAHALSILSESRSRVTNEHLSRLTYHNQLLLNVAGDHTSAQHFLFSQRLRSLLMEHLAWLWDKYPGMLILTPTTPCAGWKIGSVADLKSPGVSDSDMSLKSMEYVYLANFVGTPAISLPMGYAEGGIPVGLMAMGEWGAEEQLLAFGREGENLVGADGVRKPQGEGSWVNVLAPSNSDDN
ncbi:hypothetical protein DV738_g3847, partial [Chaetothyriales sp. CBS 135597]